MNDSTVNELIKLIRLKTRVVKYEDAFKVLTEKSRKSILSILDVDQFWEGVIPHSVILFDDAINIFKEAKFKQLKNLLFQNRQPHFTIFICLQDIFSIPPQIKRNADTVWIFTGFTDKTMFGMLCKQLGSPIKTDELWDIYNDLEYRNALIFDYDQDGIKIKTLNNN
jgi:hypothetical protein